MTETTTKPQPAPETTPEDRPAPEPERYALAHLGQSPSAIALYFDGACEPVNPGGYGTYGYAAYLGRDEQPFLFGYGSLGRSPAMTNNKAEYAALIAGLIALISPDVSLMRALPQSTSLIIYGDSQLVVRQMKGQYKTKNADLAHLKGCALRLLEGRAYSLVWIKRDKNQTADMLSRRALERARFEPTHLAFSITRHDMSLP